MHKLKALPKIISALLLFSLLTVPFSNSALAAETSGTLEDSEIRWTYDDQTNTLTLTGDGNSVLSSLRGAVQINLQTDIVVEGIRQINRWLAGGTIYLGADVEEFCDETSTSSIPIPMAYDRYVVDDDNPYFADYNGALYNKDLTYLYHVPSHQREVDLADTLETLGQYSFYYTSARYIVIPWGTMVAEENALDYLRRDEDYRETYGVNDYPYIIIPDTLRTIGKLSNYPLVRFIYSDNYTDIPLATLYPAESEWDIQERVPTWKNQYMNDLGVTSFYSFYDITASTFKTFGEKTYYFDENYKMVTGTQTINGKTYTFDENGVLQGESDTTPATTGVVYQDGKAYIYDANGNMLCSGWYQADGNWYYLNDYGAGVVNCWRLKDGKYVYLGADGKMKTNCWIKDYNEWYYVKTDGTRYESSWAKIDGNWYWFGGSGKMMSNGWLKLADGKWYYFRSGGQMATGWVKDGNKWYYLTGSGAMAANKWVKSGSYWYYLGSNGAMLTNTITPDGYRVDSEGRWI